MNEAALIWGGSLLLMGLTVGGYWASFRRRERLDHERLEEAVELGLQRPVGQFPYIDASRCIGCGACIDACPEGDVLGIVGGLAQVINGVRCIGIAACATACPVGAIEVGLGDVYGRADLPVLNEERETNISGIFIAGELGGLSLVRNAVNQGRDIAYGIAAREARGAGAGAAAATAAGYLDVAIVGAGPAGLSAALACVEKGLSYVVVEQQADFGGTIYQYPRRKLVHTQPVDLPLHGRLDKPEHSKEELLELFEGLVRRYDLAMRFGERVHETESTEHGYRLRTTAGEILARHVILATGRRGTPRKLGVPGEDLPKVMYQVRDAELYRKQRILCVGGGDSAVEAAMGLASQPGNEVTLSYRKDRFYRIKRKNQERIEEQLRRGSIKAVFNSTVSSIEPETVHLRRGDEEIVLDNDWVFVMIGGVPPFPLLRQIGIRFGDDLAVAASNNVGSTAHSPAP